MVLKSFAGIVILSAYKNVVLPFWLRPVGKYGDGCRYIASLYFEENIITVSKNELK